MGSEAPAKLTQEHLEFLDALRESGATNMFGSRPYLQNEFPALSKNEASAIITHWMRTFEARQKGTA